MYLLYALSSYLWPMGWSLTPQLLSLNANVHEECCCSAQFPAFFPNVFKAIVLG